MQNCFLWQHTHQLALLLPHSPKNWNIRRKFLGIRKKTNNKLNPCQDAVKKMRERRGKKQQQQQKYTFYYRLNHNFFLIIHPADDWFDLPWPVSYFRILSKVEKTRQDNVYLVFYSDNKYMNGSSKQTCKRFYFPFFVFPNDACSTT